MHAVQHHLTRVTGRGIIDLSDNDWILHDPIVLHVIRDAVDLTVNYPLVDQHICDRSHFQPVKNLAHRAPSEMTDPLRAEAGTGDVQVESVRLNGGVTQWLWEDAVVPLHTTSRCMKHVLK